MIQGGSSTGGVSSILMGFLPSGARNRRSSHRSPLRDSLMYRARRHNRQRRSESVWRGVYSRPQRRLQTGHRNQTLRPPVGITVHAKEISVLGPSFQNTATGAPTGAGRLRTDKGAQYSMRIRSEVGGRPRGMAQGLPTSEPRYLVPGEPFWCLGHNRCQESVVLAG